MAYFPCDRLCRSLPVLPATPEKNDESRRMRSRPSVQLLLLLQVRLYLGDVFSKLARRDLGFEHFVNLCWGTLGNLREDKVTSDAGEQADSPKAEQPSVHEHTRPRATHKYPVLSFHWTVPLSIRGTV